MAWSYEPTKLKDNPKDQIRLRIGDTIQSDPLLQDEEIQYYLEQVSNNIPRACISCIDAIIARAVQKPDYTLGPYSESNKGRLDGLRAIKQELLHTVIGLNAPIAILPTTDATFEVDMMNSTV